MPITNEEAVKVARRWGVTLADTPALQRLSDTVEEANAIAEAFANPKPPQLSREALKSMSSEQIVAAQEAGQLDNILKGGVEGGEAK